MAGELDKRGKLLRAEEAVAVGVRLLEGLGNVVALGLLGRAAALDLAWLLVDSKKKSPAAR